MHRGHSGVGVGGQRGHPWPRSTGPPWGAATRTVVCVNGSAPTGRTPLYCCAHCTRCPPAPSSSESYAFWCDWCSRFRRASSSSMSTVWWWHSSRSPTSVSMSSVAGSALRICASAGSGSVWLSGNLTTNSTYRLPLMMGLERSGMPSSSMQRNSPGLMTSPGAVRTTSTRWSRCVMVTAAPHSASRREISFLQNRSCALRMNTGCFSFCCATKTTSPGSMPGFSSALPLNTIFSPSAMPGSTCTSITSRSRTTLSPLQLGQRSLSLMASPVPWHRWHALCICCTMPGPI
mmetsp:Transcript_16754/g.41998  ORF Transcript_16754/g.41998 Transcript_16754/m.41998 type:complete len:290 (-) Transcript_16754:357-1226(-)